MKEEEGIIFGKAPGQSSLDEARFLRRVRWRSTTRTILLSLLVLMVGFIAVFVGTRILLNNQHNRISGYYIQLVRYSEPNTIVVDGPSWDAGWFGCQKQFYIIRIVGKRPIPVETVTIGFQVWGGEQVLKNNRVISIAGREYLTPNMLPVLKLYHPAGVAAGAYKDDVMHSHTDKNSPREFDALGNISGDSTVEMALSFDRLLTKREIEEMLPDGVEPLWGAIAAYSDEKIKKDPNLAHRLVGIPLGEFEIQEADFPEELRRLSQIRSHSSKRLERTSVYLKNNGIRYYGVVVAGKPEALLELKDNPTIARAVKGITIRENE